MLPIEYEINQKKQKENEHKFFVAGLKVFCIGALASTAWAIVGSWVTLLSR